MRNPVCLIVLSCVPLLSQTASRERLTLADAEQLAIRNHPRLQSARFQANALRAQVPQVKAALAPVLVGNLTGSAADNGSRLGAGGLNASSLFSRFGAGIGVSQTLYDFGRTNKLAESAALRADAQDVTVDAVRGELILQIRQAYLRVLETQRALQLGQQSLQSRQLIRRHSQRTNFDRHSISSLRRSPSARPRRSWPVWKVSWKQQTPHSRPRSVS
jgi:outer membrane protein TolC